MMKKAINIIKAVWWNALLLLYLVLFGGIIALTYILPRKLPFMKKK